LKLLDEMTKFRRHAAAPTVLVGFFLPRLFPKNVAKSQATEPQAGAWQLAAAQSGLGAGRSTLLLFARKSGWDNCSA
jgi:hypothetical protein